MRARDAIFVTNKDDNDEGAVANWALQDFSDTVWESHALQNRLASAFRGVMNVDSDAIPVRYPYASLPQAMKAGRYVYLGTATHAMAARVGTSYFTSSKVDFYDPNVGEMRGTTKEGVATYIMKAQQMSMTVQGKPLSELTGKYLEAHNMTKVFFSRG